MIEGIKIKEIKINSDERGNFREILRCDEGIMNSIMQISIGKTNPGIIKAFHYHNCQDDFFYVLCGNLILALYDARKDSSTKGEIQDILMGDSYDVKSVFIPRGVFHGYKVLGNKPSEVLYIMNNAYNRENPDELRANYDDPSINFDWSKYG